jgi:hypothetical protein
MIRSRKNRFKALLLWPKTKDRPYLYSWPKLLWRLLTLPLVYISFCFMYGAMFIALDPYEAEQFRKGL